MSDHDRLVWIDLEMTGLDPREHRILEIGTLITNASLDIIAEEVPRLEEKLTILATIAQISPLLGLIGTVMGFMSVFGEMQKAGLMANVEQLSTGVWQALICTGAGLALAAAAYACYNYLVARVNDLVLDMEKSATEIVNMVAEVGGARKA